MSSFLLGEGSISPVFPITVGGVAVNVMDSAPDTRPLLTGLGMPLLPQLLMNNASALIPPTPPPPPPQPATSLAGNLKLNNNLTNMLLLVSQNGTLPSLSAIMNILDIEENQPDKKNAKLGLNPKAPEFKPKQPMTTTTTPTATTTTSQVNGPICHFYIRGLCMHGVSCRYSHSWPSPVASAPVPPSASQLSSQRAIQFLLNAAGCQPTPHMPPSDFGITACEKYNNGTCNDESWPHKLRHFYSESSDGNSTHVIDSACIYPEPRSKQRTCQIHTKKMLKWEPTTRTWTQATPAAIPLPEGGQIIIMTYNVLFDHYMKNHIHSTKRYHALLEVLREANFDICCLQEVQPAFLRLLLKEEWVRRDYWASAAEECPSLSFSGVVVLSRWPFLDISVHDLPQTCGNISPSVIGHLKLTDQITVGICSAHLSQSDIEVRTCQLANLLRKIRHEDHIVLLGDFNVHALNAGSEFSDAWVDSHGESHLEDGWTLSLSNNPLALYMNENDQRESSDPDDPVRGGRVDMIFVRSGKNKQQKERLQTVKSSAQVGGKDSCSHYLVRRVIRLAASMQVDPFELLDTIGISEAKCHQLKTTRDPKHAATVATPSPSPFLDKSTLQQQLDDTIDALKNIPHYLCPSDHFYVKTSLRAVPVVPSGG